MAKYAFARRIEQTSGNVIREILKLTQQPDVISFAGGLPSPDSFPAEQLKAIATEALSSDARSVLQYGVTEGSPALRELLAQRFSAQSGRRVEPDETLILTGSQQGIDLAFRVFLEPGDKVLVERPTYLAVLQILSLYEAQPVHVPGDSEGMDPDALREAIRRERPKLIYVTPTFRNPSGETWSTQRRREAARIAAEHGVPIIEDDPYGALRYSGQPVPPLKAFDEEGYAIYLGSFSKVISPGIRLGYAIGPKEILARMTVAKQGADVHTSNLSQRLVEGFLRGGALDGHIARICDDYGRKLDVMADAVRRHFPKSARFNRPDGGLFLWVSLAPGISTTRLLEEAVKQKVAFIPGVPFYADGGGDDSMRLNFSNAGIDEIEAGIERLGRVIRQAQAAPA